MTETRGLKHSKWKIYVLVHKYKFSRNITHYITKCLSKCCTQTTVLQLYQRQTAVLVLNMPDINHATVVTKHNWYTFLSERLISLEKVSVLQWGGHKIHPHNLSLQSSVWTMNEPFLHWCISTILVYWPNPWFRRESKIIGNSVKRFGTQSNIGSTFKLSYQLFIVDYHMVIILSIIILQQP